MQRRLVREHLAWCMIAAARLSLRCDPSARREEKSAGLIKVALGCSSESWLTAFSRLRDASRIPRGQHAMFERIPDGLACLTAGASRRS